jgi:hypothetical protein
MNTLERLLTEPQAAKLLAMSPRKLWSIRQAGEISHIVSGKNIRYEMTDLRTWIDNHKRSCEPSRN